MDLKKFILGHFEEFFVVEGFEKSKQLFFSHVEKILFWHSLFFEIAGTRVFPHSSFPPVRKVTASVRRRTNSASEPLPRPT
jgi:hypothetical protein